LNDVTFTSFDFPDIGIKAFATHV